MVTFSTSLVLLILGYLLYGKLISWIIKPDPDRKTPAIANPDGVDYVPLPGWKIFMIQFLNIAGTGPIFGAIMGAKFGTAAYLWIVIGCIFAGAVHDYISGMISLRNNGESLPQIIGQYIGVHTQRIAIVFIVLLMVLVGVVFVYTPAELLARMTPHISMLSWVLIIFAYYILASILPIDKIIGKLYPIFAISLIFMALGIIGVLFITWPTIPEITDGLQNTNPAADIKPIFPMLFISIACGAISGFHATQSPLMARCMTNEKQGRPIFYGAMITEGVVALAWAAAANVYYSEYGYDTNESAGSIVSFISNTWLGRAGGVFALLGVVFAPITSGDTALRSARLVIADFINMSQKKILQRLAICLPLFAVTGLVLVWSMRHRDGFEIIWRYFAWSNQTLSVFTLWAISAYLYRNYGHWHLLTLIPAIFMTMVVTSYIMLAPEGLGLIEQYDMVLLCSGLLALVVSRVFYARERSISKKMHFEK
ncbi:MAG: carbon starvation protein A [Paludibacteraceae bacterium]|nr:carbon starvation protein A [Paludibacteraceae bacterium]